MRNLCSWIIPAIIILAAVWPAGHAALAKTIYPLEASGLQGFDLLVKGAEREVELGGAMCIGDFNGDGVMDLAVGSTRSNSPRGVAEAGTVSVYFGGSAYNGLPEKFEAVKDGKESALLYGSSEHEYVGEFLACGDLRLPV